MQDSEERHFDAEQPRGNADVDVWVADLVGWLERPAGRCEEGDDHLYSELATLALDIDCIEKRIHTVCQKEKKITNLMQMILSAGLYSPNFSLSWI